MSLPARTIILLAAAFAAAPSAATAAPPPTLAVEGGVQALAMDGSNVAIAGLGIDRVGTVHGRCTSVTSWNVRRGTIQVLSGSGTCRGGAAISSVALTGAQAGWVVSGSGNSEAYDDLYATSLAHPVERHLASAVRDGQATDDVELEGPWLAGPFADGSRLAYGSWATSFDNPEHCGLGNGDPSDPCRLTVAGASFDPDGGRPRALGFARHTWVSPQAGDSGRVVALDGDGDLAVLGADGALRRLVHPVRVPAVLSAPSRTGGPWPGFVGLRRDRLAFVTLGDTLDVYATENARLVHSFPVPISAQSSRRVARPAPTRPTCRTAGSPPDRGRRGRRRAG